MTIRTLADYLSAHSASDAPQADAVAEAVAALGRGAVAIRDAVTIGALGSARSGTRGGSADAGGEAHRRLDLHADALLLDAVRTAPVALHASEELEHPIVVNRTAPLAIASDPLNDSANIDTNVSIGTVFSILPVIGRPENEPLASYLQPGANQLAAGCFVYGPQLALALTLGRGTDIFVYSPRLGEFVRAQAGITVPATTQELAINAANYRHWDDGVRHYYDDCLAGSSGPHGRDFTMHWVASVVADAYRILMRGGIYMYPGDARKGCGSGRLRLVYEANPIAMLMANAGGAATDGTDPILERIPASLHERVPLVFGSRSEVREVARYAAEHNAMGLRSPLFGTRGLFRN